MVRRNKIQFDILASEIIIKNEVDNIPDSKKEIAAERFKKYEDPAAFIAEVEIKVLVTEFLREFSILESAIFDLAEQFSIKSNKSLDEVVDLLIVAKKVSEQEYITIKSLSTVRNQVLRCDLKELNVATLHSSKYLAKIRRMYISSNGIF